MKYIVKYEDRIIGVYNKINDNHAEYTVDKDQIEKIKNEGIYLLSKISKDYTGKGIAYFDGRIRNCKRFEGAKISYQTDPITLEEVM